MKSFELLSVILLTTVFSAPTVAENTSKKSSFKITTKRPVNTKHDDPRSSYTIQMIEGYEVLVSSRFKGHEALRDEMLKEIGIQLHRTNTLMKPDVKAFFKTVEIWVERDYPGRIRYYSSAEWLKQNGYTPDKEGTIEIPSDKVFLNWKRRPVMNIMHELIHAYHHKVIGTDEPRIAAAFLRYKEKMRDKKVMRPDGRLMTPYALTNHVEFFAEMSEAYFWVNDYQPFVLADLKVSDPQTLKLMKEIWGERRK